MSENENPQLFKIAGVQMDISIGEIDTNRQRMIEKMKEVAANGTRLVVFPECALTGYCFDSFDEAMSNAESLDGPSLSALVEACSKLNIFALYGFIEKDDDKIYNALALIGPDGLVGNYRKIHIPKLGLDQFVTPGDRPFAVHDVEGVKVGINICYDCSFPESARILSLQGADVILLPTNWPPGALCTADYIPNARALENNVYYMSVNRVGEERGFAFIGKSKICDTNGFDIEFANHTNPAILYAEIDPAIARQKRLVRVAGKHEIHRFNDRRPDQYDELTRALE